MKHWCLTFCLVIAALFGSVESGCALPKCPGSPISASTNTDISNWHNCVGTVNYSTGAKYTGEFKNNARSGNGIFNFNPTHYRNVKEGIWNDNQFLYAQRTPYSKKTAKPSPLRTEFIKLSKENRKQLQSNLKDLGYYNSTIDGLYGRGTSGALTAYNKEQLGNSDLKVSINVTALVEAVLALNDAEGISPETPIVEAHIVAEIVPEVEVAEAEPEVEIPEDYQAGI